MASISPTATATSAPLEQGKNYTPALVTLTSLFFIWGFMTCLNDILIPHLKELFKLNYTKVMLIQFVFFTAYFIMSTPSAIVVRKIGYKIGIVIGLLVSGVGCLLFYPAAGVQSYGLFLFAFFVLASGITLLQVAANPYVAILGKPETSSARLVTTQAFNSLGTFLAPFFGSFLILSVALISMDAIATMAPEAAAAAVKHNANAIQMPYLGLAGVFVLLAVFFTIMKLPKIVEEPREPGAKHEGFIELNSKTLKYPHLFLGTLAIFFYVGGEVAIGSVLVNYLSGQDVGGFIKQIGQQVLTISFSGGHLSFPHVDLTKAVAAQYLSLYWGGAMVGRFIGAVVLRYVKPRLVLALNGTVVCVLLAITMATHGHVSMIAVLAIGLFNSIMFPTIFTLAIAKLGRHTSSGSGLLCMAIVGGAIVPVIVGVFADKINLHFSFIVPLLCYLYIIFYGVKGAEPKLPQGVTEAA
jgi:FHS family L-fucose permease-like MFS transporter